MSNTLQITRDPEMPPIVTFERLDRSEPKMWWRTVHPEYGPYVVGISETTGAVSISRINGAKMPINVTLVVGELYIHIPDGGKFEYVGVTNDPRR